MLQVFKAQFIGNFIYRFRFAENSFFGKIHNFQVQVSLADLPVSFFTRSPKKKFKPAAYRIILKAKYQVDRQLDYCDDILMF